MYILRRIAHLALLAMASWMTACTVSESDEREATASVRAADTGGIKEGTVEAFGVLRAVNDLSFDDLVRYPGPHLPTAVAANITAVRLGDDGRAETADDHYFGTLAELDAVPLVGRAAFDALLAFARESGWLVPQFPLPPSVKLLHLRFPGAVPGRMLVLTFSQSMSGAVTFVPSGDIPWDGRLPSGGTPVAVAADGNFKGAIVGEGGNPGCMAGTRIAGRLTLESTESDPVLHATMDVREWYENAEAQAPCHSTFDRTWTGSVPVIDLSIPGTQVANVGTLRFVKRPSGERLIFVPKYFGGTPLRQSSQYPDLFTGFSPLYDYWHTVNVGSGPYDNGYEGFDGELRVPAFFL